MNSSKTKLILIALFILNSYSMFSQALQKNNQMIVAYYGRPNVSALGILGQLSPDELASQLKTKVDEYKAVSPNTEIIPAFDIIYGLASAEPGPNGDYIINLSESTLEPYIKMAEEQGFLLFIDLQLGKKTPIQAIQPVLKYLSHKNVHLAIDPEFEVAGLDVRPGKVIGHITGDDVNQVQSAMVAYLKENNITEMKHLMLHNFTQKMVSGKSQVKDYPGINLIMNLDGHGSPQLKINIYNGLYTSQVAERVDGGFKLFFKEDKPMMTPAEVLGQQSAGGSKMARMPRFINFE